MLNSEEIPGTVTKPSSPRQRPASSRILARPVSAHLASLPFCRNPGAGISPTAEADGERPIRWRLRGQGQRSGCLADHGCWRGRPSARGLCTLVPDPPTVTSSLGLERRGRELSGGWQHSKERSLLFLAKYRQPCRASIPPRSRGWGWGTEWGSGPFPPLL